MFNTLLFLLGNLLNTMIITEPYYTNSNDISLTTREYNYVLRNYGQNFYEKMTKDDFKWISKMYPLGDNYRLKATNDLELNDSSYHQTAYKRISIVKSCLSTICNITIQARWLKSPNIRSYDLIGARLINTSLANKNIITRVITDKETKYYTDYQLFSNGFGTSIKIPKNANNIIIEQNFEVYNKGTIFGSYQHAIKPITLKTSQKYTIDVNGFGNVFLYNGLKTITYDEMSGVYTTL